MPPDPSIYKAYDIRGLHESQIDGNVAQQIGRAFAVVLGALSGKRTEDLRVGVGRDMRNGAATLASRYRRGLMEECVTVIDIGEVGSEMLYYLVGSRGLDGGLMCTASHNPAAYTGVKLVREGALPLSGETGIQDIRAIVEQGFGAGGDRGSHEETDIYEEFQAATLEFIDPSSIAGLKVVVDGGNGMAGPMIGPVLRGLDIELIETYFTPDGNFPDHEPNPLLAGNRQFVIDQVLEHEADLGIAWDGDADRCFFIDETGCFVDGDFLTAMLAESLLVKSPGEAILYDVRASRAVADTVAVAGGTSHVNRVGHAFFKARMRAEGSLFGGEVSGHYYFRDFFCADSGTLPALLILELLANSGLPMSALVEPYRSAYFISGEINSEVEDPEGRIEAIAERYSDGQITRLDGISIDYDDWHFNVRSSNTEPLLRLCLESLVSVEDMERRRDEVLELIRS